MRLRALLSSISSLDSGIPYNWNWQRDWHEVGSFLEACPIVLMDVGARGDAPPELRSLRRFVHRVGFEPDPDECRRLNASSRGTFFPTLLGGSVGQSSLQLYQPLGYSSVLPVAERFQRLWTGHLPQGRRLQLETATIDDVLQDRPDLAPDLLKIDTQGSELDILRGAENSFSTIGLVEVEVEFTEMYDGQPLFGDVAAFMVDHGYELLYINRVLVTRSAVYQGPSRGQLLFGDALFGKREDALDDFSVDQLAKYVILLCQYGHMDIAWQLLEENSTVADRVPGLRGCFRTHRNPIARAALMQLDKLLCVALHMRQYNQRGTDSDRCWPIR